MTSTWKVSPLEQCIEPVTYSNKIQRKNFLNDGDYPIVSQEEAFINGRWNDRADVFEVKTPVVLFGDHTKVIKYVDFDFVLGADGVKILQPRKELVPRFLYYWLQSVDLPDLGYARHYRLLKELNVPLPNVPEQRRIVDILDKAFEGIGTAKANAETNLKNARATFETHVKGVFEQGRPSWQEKPLVTLCSLFVDSAHRTPKYQDEGMPALRPRDVVDGRLRLTAVARVSEEEYEIQSKRHRPSEGDIVYSRELSFGWAAILPRSPRVCLSQGMCLFRPKTDILDSGFLLYVLNGPVGREQAVHSAVGAAHPHINLNDIKAYQIPLPPLAEQKGIAKVLDNLAESTQLLEQVYRRKLEAFESLKKSVLTEAFAGSL